MNYEIKRVNKEDLPPTREYGKVKPLRKSDKQYSLRGRKKVKINKYDRDYKTVQTTFELKEKAII